MDIHIKLTVDDRLVGAGRWLARRLSARRVGALALCGALGATAVLAAPVTRPHSFKAGDRISADEINASFDVLYDELNAREIGDDLAFEVEDCVELRATLASLDDKLIASRAIVTLELPAGTFACPDEVVIDHRDGRRIRILGQGSDETTLTFHDTGGIEIPAGRSAGAIDKLTLIGAGGLKKSGVTVGPSGYARVGGDVVVQGFVHGVLTIGGYVDARGVIAQDNEANGFEATLGGTINASGAVASDNVLYGFSASIGSAILADEARADGNDEFGFTADVGSAIHAPNATALDSKHGFNANLHSVITADMATASNNSAFGMVGWDNSTMSAVSATTEDNVDADYGAGFGSFTHVRTPATAGPRYADPGANVLDTARQSFIFTD